MKKSGKKSGKKSVLITGASTGIGFETALSLSQRGYQVFAGVRKKEDGERLCAKDSVHQNIKYVLLDVTVSETIDSALKVVTDSETTLAAIINNAGIAVSSALEVVSLKELRQQFEVNVFGFVAVTQKFIPLLRESHGRIINISSVAGRTVTPGLSPYCASKASMEVFSDALRMELYSSNIKVILIEPGSIATPIWKKSLVTAENQFGNVPGHLKVHYERLAKGLSKLVHLAEKNASPPEIVIDAIIKALELKDPATRYLVGRDAKMAILQNLLPDKLRDKTILNYILRYSSYR